MTKREWKERRWAKRREKLAVNKWLRDAAHTVERREGFPEGSIRPRMTAAELCGRQTMWHTDTVGVLGEARRRLTEGTIFE